MSDESSLDKLLRLATANVKTYQRFERGREQVVHAHTESRADAHIKAHDSAHNTASRTARATAESKAREGEQVFRERGEAAWAKHQQEWEAKHGGRRDESSFVTTQPPPALRRNGRSLQEFAEDMESDRKQRAGRLGTSPAFGQAPVSHEGVINSAADQAVDNAVVNSGQMGGDEVAQLRRQMADMQQRLEAMETEAKQAAADAGEEVKGHMAHLLHEKGRAALALDLLAVVASLAIAFFAGGGAAGVIAEVMAAKWTVDAAKAIATFHVVDKGVGREAMAHPVATGKAKAQAATSAAAAEAAKARASASRAKAGAGHKVQQLAQASKDRAAQKSAAKVRV